MDPSSSHFLVATTVPGLEEQQRLVALLREAGHKIRWAYLDGASPAADGSRGADKPHRLADPDSRGSRAHPGVRRLLSSRRRLERAARRDPWFRKAVGGVDQVIALDATADVVLEIAHGLGRGVGLVESSAAPATLAGLQAWARLRLAFPEEDDAGQDADEDRLPVDIDALVPLVIEASTQPLLPPPGRALLRRLVRTVHRSQGAADVLHLLGAVDPGADSALAGWRVRAELDVHGATAADPVLTAATLLREADQALVDGDREGTLADAVLALELIFHRELHSDGPAGPMVADPRAYLEPVRDSRVWRLLTTPGPRTGPLTGAEEARPVRTVEVLPGAYPGFAQPLLRALREDPGLTVDVIDLGRRDSGQFRTMGVWTEAVSQRLAAGLGEQVGWREEGEALEADVVFADWADKGALWASLVAPPRARLVVRVHSVDALRPWVHLVDWGRVADLVCVSAHILEVVRELLGPALEGVRLHVVPNVIDLGLAMRESDRPRRTLGMVGWAQRVKDPLLAVEVLAALLEHDAAWRLMLVGQDFPERLPHSGQEYAASFRQRVLQDDVRDRVEFTGHLRDLEPALGQFDFVLNCSVRESQPVGLSEAMQAGAVPVVRDWPQFAARRAATRMYPRHWVVGSVEEAVRRVGALTDPAAYRAAQQEARGWLEERLDPARTGERYRRLVRGELTEDGAPVP